MYRDKFYSNKQKLRNIIKESTKRALMENRHENQMTNIKMAKQGVADFQRNVLPYLCSIEDVNLGDIVDDLLSAIDRLDYYLSSY